MKNNSLFGVGKRRKSQSFWLFFPSLDNGRVNLLFKSPTKHLKNAKQLSRGVLNILPNFK